MSKITSAKKPSEIVEPSADAATPSANTNIPAIALAKFWLLEEGTAKKLGLRSTGSLSYQVLADHDRKNLFIALTQNEGGGFHSKERVNMHSIEACLAAREAGEPFPSKALKDAYKSRSSNNAGFMTARRPQSLHLRRPAQENHRSGVHCALRRRGRDRAPPKAHGGHDQTVRDHL